MTTRLLTLFLGVLLAGCKTELPEDIFTVFIEAPTSSPNSGQAPVRLTVSGVVVSVMKIPMVPAEHFLNTEIVEAGPPDIRSHYLLVQVDPKSAQSLRRATTSAEALGKQLVLLVNDEAIGIQRISEPVLDGNLFFAVERKDMGAKAAAAYWSERMNRSILQIRKWREKEGK